MLLFVKLLIFKIGFLVKLGFKNFLLRIEYISDESLYICSLDEFRGN